MIELEKILEACDSKATRTAYKYGIEQFNEWLGDRELNYTNVKAYRAYLVRKDVKPQTINVRLAAIRFYVKELAEEDAMTIEQSRAICAVNNLKVKGRRLGKWLELEDANKILNKPDTSTRTGLRDRAILALMIGAGLRRSEVVKIERTHFEKRNDKWIICGLVGKHGRTRNIPLADWIMAILNPWLDVLDYFKVKNGPIIRKVSWSEKKEWIGGPLDPTSLRYIVQSKYGKDIGRFRISPHDLRRTAARLAFEGEVPIAQIQLMLGHADQQTTEKYIGARQDLTIAPSDKMGIEVKL